MSQVTIPAAATRLPLIGNWLNQLCAVDSTQGGDDYLLTLLLPHLSSMGAELHVQPVADGRCNVLATWGRPRVLFTTHLDTVAPHIAPRLAPDRVWGRGSCDAKGQLVCQLEAIAALLAEGRTDLAWLGVTGEETDSLGARSALELAPRLDQVALLVNGEPTGNKLASGQRGVQHLVLKVAGRSAHSSLPHLGRNALWPLVDWLERLRDIPCPIHESLGAESWNLGRVEGGEAANSVPSQAEAHLLGRIVPGTTFLEAARAAAPEHGLVEVRLQEPWDLYPRIEGFDYATMPFGSDAPTLRPLAKDGRVAVCGPGSIAVAHTPDEHLTFEELLAGVDLNARLAKTVLD